MPGALHLARFSRDVGYHEPGSELPIERPASQGHTQSLLSGVSSVEISTKQPEPFPWTGAPRPTARRGRWGEGHPSGTIYRGCERRAARFPSDQGYSSAFSLISKYRFRTKEVISSG